MLAVGGTGASWKYWGRCHLEPAAMVPKHVTRQPSQEQLSDNNFQPLLVTEHYAVVLRSPERLQTDFQSFKRAENLYIKKTKEKKTTQGEKRVGCCQV